MNGAQTVKGGVLWMRTSTARLCTINARGDDERGSTHRRRMQGGPRINYVAACPSACPSAVRRSVGNLKRRAGTDGEAVVAKRHHGWALYYVMYNHSWIDVETFHFRKQFSVSQPC